MPTILEPIKPNEDMDNAIQFPCVNDNTGEAGILYIIPKPNYVLTIYKYTDTVYVKKV